MHDRNYRYSALYPSCPPLFLAKKNAVSHIVGVDGNEMRAWIEELEAFSTQVRFTYSHKWRAGDVLVWNNRCTLHRAAPYDPVCRRTLYRTRVKGDASVPSG